MKLILILSLLLLWRETAAADINDYLGSNYHISSIESKLVYPYIYFIGRTEVFYDKMFPVEQGDKTNFLYTKTDLLTDLNLNAHFTIHTNFSLEKIKGSNFAGGAFSLFPGENPFYGTSLITRELAGQFKYERTLIRLGKIAPLFAAGSDRENEMFYEGWYGISGTFLNESYRLEEKLGIEVNMSLFEEENSKIKLQAAAFTNDNTNLFKKPFLARREIIGFIVPDVTTAFPDMPRKRMAGSAHNLKSHSIALQGFTSLNSRDALSFSFGYRSQYASLSYPSEKGYGISVQYIKVLFNDLILGIFGEGATVRNAYSIPNFHEYYLTGGAALSFAGFKGGYVRNNYQNNFFNKKVAFIEYFLGFEFPGSGVAIFLAKKQYKFASELNPGFSGFGINIRFKIK